MEPQIDTTLEQLMFSLIEVWKQSGQTQKVFCQERDLAYSKFQYWMQRYKGRQYGQEKSPAFMTVSVKNGSTQKESQPAVELTYPDGRRLVFHQGVDASFLRSLLG